MAGWQSGYAAACKAVNAGSIRLQPPYWSINDKPSIIVQIMGVNLISPSGGIGRHKDLKSLDKISCRFKSGLGYQF